MLYRTRGPGASKVPRTGSYSIRNAVMEWLSVAQVLHLDVFVRRHGAGTRCDGRGEPSTPLLQR